MSTASPPPPKKGFFRRLSLSASAARAQGGDGGDSGGTGAARGPKDGRDAALGHGAPPLPPNASAKALRAVSSPLHRGRSSAGSPGIGGPAYESLPAGADTARHAATPRQQPMSNGGGPSTPSSGRMPSTASPRSPPPAQGGQPPVPPVPTLPSLPLPPPSSLGASPFPPPSAYRAAGPLPYAVPPSGSRPQRHPIVPALASPPNTPPREGREASASPTSPVLNLAAVGPPFAGPVFDRSGYDTGRFPTPPVGVQQSYSRPPLLGGELPARTSSSTARPIANGPAPANGDGRSRMSSLPPGAAAARSTYEIIASSSGPPARASPPPTFTPNGSSVRSPPSSFTPPVPRASAAAAQGPPTLPPVPSLLGNGDGLSLTASTSMYRFDDAEGPAAPAVPQPMPNGTSAAAAPSKPRTSARRSSSTSRAVRPVVTASTAPLATPPAGTAAEEVLDNDAARAAAVRTSPAKVNGHPPSAYTATQERARPSSLEARPAASASAPGVPGKDERRLSRPLPRPPSGIQPSQSPVRQGSIVASPTQSPTRTSRDVAARAISPTASRALPTAPNTTSPRTTMHIVQSSDARKRESAMSTGSADSSGSAAGARAVRPSVVIQNSAVRGALESTVSSGPSRPEAAATPALALPQPGVPVASASQTPAPVRIAGSSATSEPRSPTWAMSNGPSPLAAEKRASQTQRHSTVPIEFEFPRSPTLQPLVDPRNEKKERKPSPLSPSASTGPPVQISLNDAVADGPAEPRPSNGGKPASPTRPTMATRQAAPKPSANGLSPVLPSSQLPPRVSSANGRRIASSPLASPVFSSPGQVSAGHASLQPYSPQSTNGPRAPPPASLVQARSASASYARQPPSNAAPHAVPVGLGIQERRGSPQPHAPAPMPPPHPPSRSSTGSKHNSAVSSGASRAPPRRRPKRMTLLWLLEDERIASTLISFLSIDTFLNVLGSDPAMRERFGADMVARWVFNEWGITYDPDFTRSRPGMSTWERFLESMLHDPAVYSTYPVRYYSLLENLSLAHSQVVLYLRSLPASAFPYSAPTPFDDDLGLPPALSSSIGSFSAHLRPRSRLGSQAGSDTASIAAGSMMPGKMPKREHVVEIVMPEPLAPQRKAPPSWDGVPAPPDPAALRKARRRGSVSSLASTTTFAFGSRKRASSIAMPVRPDLSPLPPLTAPHAVPIPQGKAGLPPVSFPSAKRYNFTRGQQQQSSARSRSSIESSRPGSIMSVQSSPSFGHHARVSSFYSRQSFAVDHNAPPVPTLPAHLPVPPPIGAAGHRASFASSDARSSSRRSHGGTASPVGRRYDSPTASTRDLHAAAGGQVQRPEPAFDRPPPYTHGRAPILRVFVPELKWPSAEAAAAAMAQLERGGAAKRLRLGDLVVNTAVRQPKTTEHVLIFVPYNRHLLLPLSYVHCATGHLPHIVDGLALPPSYYYPFLPTPQILYLDLAPYAARVADAHADPSASAIRLLYDRRDVTVASGARLSAKRYLHVAGLELGPGDRCAPEWFGMISLEAEGTAEGKTDLEARLGWGASKGQPVMGPWEVVREKSMSGTVWLRLVKEAP